MKYLLLTVPSLIVYLAGSFVALSFNVSTWGYEGRLAAASVAVTTTIIMLAVWAAEVMSLSWAGAPMPRRGGGEL